MNTSIHPRVFVRHPELTDEDVRVAWENSVDKTLRVDSPNFPEYVCTGYDGKGRHVEMVGAMTREGWLVYHAMTPPSKKTLKEISDAKRRAM